MASWHSPQPTRDPGPSPPGVGRRPQPLGGGGVGRVRRTPAPHRSPPRRPTPHVCTFIQLAPGDPRGPAALAVDRRALLSPLDPHSNVRPAAIPRPPAPRSGQGGAPASQRRPDGAAQASTMSRDLCSLIVRVAVCFVVLGKEG